MSAVVFGKCYQYFSFKDMQTISLTWILVGSFVEILELNKCRERALFCSHTLRIEIEIEHLGSSMQSSQEALVAW